MAGITWLEILKAAAILLMSLLFLYGMAKLFTGHFLPVIKEGAEREFRTRAGVYSLFGIVLCAYLLIHSEALDVVMNVLSGAGDHSSREASFPVLSWGLLMITVGNLILLGVLAKLES